MSRPARRMKDPLRHLVSYLYGSEDLCLSLRFAGDTCLCLRVVFRTCSCVSFSQFRFLLAQGQWMGWGGMLTFLELAHMSDATPWLGWGGVGEWDVNVP